MALVLLTALAACRRVAEQQGPVIVPTAVPTPRSTPLPPVPTVAPVGSEESPLQMVIRPVGSLASARNVAARFETALTEASGVAVDVVLVERYAEAVTALCSSSAGQAAAVWLDGVAYMAAIAQGCGTPALQVVRGQGRSATTGEAVELIANDDLGITDVRPLVGSTFCRLGRDDPYSWLIPVLVLEANGVDPFRDLEAVTDYEDTEALVAAVAEGTCDAAGVAESAFEELGDTLEGVRVLTTTVEFPYGVLLFPPEATSVRNAVTDALLTLSLDEDAAEVMQPLLGQDALERADEDDFDDLLDFMASTGLDFAQLGN